MSFSFGWRGPNIIKNGLVLYLDPGSPNSFYDKSSTILKDISGSGNNGTLLPSSVNRPIYDSSNGGCLSFDNVDDYLQVPSSASFAFGTDDFTLEIWIYPNSFSQYTHMFAFPDQNTMALKAGKTTDGNGLVYLYTPSFSTYDTITGCILVLNNWNHLIMTRSSSVAYAYLNGSSKGSKSGFNNNFTSQILNIHNGYPTEFNQCKISSIRVYNRALSASEVLQNYNSTKSRFGL